MLPIPNKRVKKLPRPILAYPAGVPCPLCGGVVEDWHTEWAVPPGANPQKTRRLPLQAARWAKSQSRQGKLRAYIDQSAPGQQYRDYFSDQEVQDADTDAQADPRY
jgi:hypothetical protein